MYFTSLDTCTSTETITMCSALHYLLFSSIPVYFIYFQECSLLPTKPISWPWMGHDRQLEKHWLSLYNCQLQAELYYVSRNFLSWVDQGRGTLAAQLTFTYSSNQALALFLVLQFQSGITVWGSSTRPSLWFILLTLKSFRSCGCVSTACSQISPTLTSIV